MHKKEGRIRLKPETITNLVAVNGGGAAPSAQCSLPPTCQGVAV